MGFLAQGHEVPSVAGSRGVTLGKRSPEKKKKDNGWILRDGFAYPVAHRALLTDWMERGDALLITSAAGEEDNHQLAN